MNEQVAKPDAVSKAMSSIMLHQYSTVIGPIPLEQYRNMCRNLGRSLNVINYTPTLDQLDGFKDRQIRLKNKK